MIWSLITGNPLTRLIVKIAVGALFLLTFGKINQWRGSHAQKAKQADKDARAHQKAIEDVLRETPNDDSVDDLRRRMSDRARKP